MASNANFVWQRASNLILHWRNIFAISIWKKCRLLVIFVMFDLLMKMFWNVTRKFIIYFTNYILQWKSSRLLNIRSLTFYNYVLTERIRFFLSTYASENSNNSDFDSKRNRILGKDGSNFGPSQDFDTWLIFPAEISMVRILGHLKVRCICHHVIFRINFGHDHFQFKAYN